MNQQAALADALERFVGGQTLATLCAEAAKEMNGTGFKSIRPNGGRRWILLACVTGESELEKLGDIGEREAQQAADWAAVSLAEAVSRAMMCGGFCYFVDSSSRITLPPVALIAAGPDSITKLERVLGLQP
jgi:hypothetical protein